jgi:serine/threonine protein kinase
MLDLLDETLNQRIERWRSEQEQHDLSGIMVAAATTFQQQQQQAPVWRRSSFREPNLPSDTLVDEQQMDHLRYQTLYLEKIRVMSEIASALDYIHSHGVIFRDLKPNNIGFIGNTVQLFDFGLSRELPVLDTSIPFAMSGKVGTLRYMAPEVARHQHYNVSADVYSFGMVSFELLSLEKPFDGWTRDLHSEFVCTRGLRPEINNTLHPIPAEMKMILEQAWSSVPSNRGTMAQIGVQLRFLEAKQVSYLAEQQLHIEFQKQQQQQLHAQQLSMAAAAALSTTAPNRFYVDMSYCMSPSPPRKHHRCMSVDDSIGTIETGSLSADSEGYFF